MLGISEKFKIGLKHPFRFLGRQFYRLVVVFPYEVIIGVLAWLHLSLAGQELAPSVETCVFISSLIYCKDRKLTYGVRSVFNAEKRAEQTLNTIRSIRERAPGVVIVLIEAGLREDIPEEIKKAVDTFVYVGNKKIVRVACDSPFKSLGETALLLMGMNFLPSAKRYFKMSGRYWLNSEFNISAWQGAGFTFFHIRPDFISTRLYSFSATVKRRWCWSLIKSLPYLFLDYPIEYLLPKFIPEKFINRIARVGVSGLDGVTGTEVKE